jgi:hypothetical protein
MATFGWALVPMAVLPMWCLRDRLAALLSVPDAGAPKASDATGSAAAMTAEPAFSIPGAGPKTGAIPAGAAT